MHRRTTRLNRIVFALLGLVLLGAGSFLVGRHFSWFSRLPSTERIYSRPEARWIHDHHWVWYAVVAGAVVVGLLALGWLLVQPRVDRLRTLRLDDDSDQRGHTSMAGDVLAEAVEEEIEQLPGVARARVIVIGAASAPEIVVRVAATPGANLAEVHERVVGDAVRSARTALDSDELPAQVHLMVSGRGSAERTPVR